MVEQQQRESIAMKKRLNSQLKDSLRNEDFLDNHQELPFHAKTLHMNIAKEKRFCVIKHQRIHQLVSVTKTRTSITFNLIRLISLKSPTEL